MLTNNTPYIREVVNAQQAELRADYTLANNPGGGYLQFALAAVVKYIWTSFWTTMNKAAQTGAGRVMIDSPVGVSFLLVPIMGIVFMLIAATGGKLV